MVIKQEVDQTDPHDPILINFWLHVPLHNDDLLKGISNSCQWILFLFYFPLTSHFVCRLNVIPFTPTVHHKIHFIILSDRLSVRILGILLISCYYTILEDSIMIMSKYLL